MDAALGRRIINFISTTKQGYWQAPISRNVLSQLPKRCGNVTSIGCTSSLTALQLAVLTTNLPVAWDSSVFLRVDESRVDVIKALITGPEGTPYHNGWSVHDAFE